MKQTQIREVVNGWLVLETDNKTVYRETFAEQVIEALAIAKSFLETDEKVPADK